MLLRNVLSLSTILMRSPETLIRDFFVRSFTFEVRNFGKLGISLARHEENSQNILKKFHPLMQIFHAAIPVNYTSEFRKIVEATKHSFYSNHAKQVD